MIRIDRCICHDCTFAEIKTVADRSGLTSPADLRGIIEFGYDCRLCAPYVDEMLETGNTVFTELLAPRDH